MSVQTASPPCFDIFDRDLLLRAYSALREEPEPLTRRRTLIRQIWLPSEWLAGDDEDCGLDEPACSATYGEARQMGGDDPSSAATKSKPPAVVPPPRVLAPDASSSAASAPAADYFEGAGSGRGRADTAYLGISGSSSPAGAATWSDGCKTSGAAYASSKTSASSGSSSQEAAAVSSAGKTQSKPSSVRTTLNLNDNLTPSSDQATDGLRRAIGSSALNVNVNVGRGQANPAPAKKAAAAPAAAQAQATAAAPPQSAEQQATAALSAMLGLSALKASGAAPAAPVPPPRNTSQNVCLAAAAAWRPGPSRGLNPHASEFRPFLSTPAATQFPPQAAVLPPPRQSPAPPKTSKSNLEDDFGGELTNLLGQQLCDEICGGRDVEITPSSARTSVGTSRETEEIEESERLQAERMLAVM